jgi:hypothetical protein
LQNKNPLVPFSALIRGQNLLAIITSFLLVKGLWEQHGIGVLHNMRKMGRKTLWNQEDLEVNIGYTSY